MVGQLNMQTSNPLSLFDQALFVVVNNDLGSELGNNVIKKAWNSLRDSNSDFGLQQTMLDIEKSFVDGNVPKACKFSSKEEEQKFLESFLERHVNNLFKNLAAKYLTQTLYTSALAKRSPTKTPYLKVIPVDLSAYKHLHQIVGDQSLVKIYKVIKQHLEGKTRSKKKTKTSARPETAKTIKRRLNEPKVKVKLGNIESLDLSKLDLETFPSEISAFAQLGTLVANSNKITTIPEFLAGCTRLRRLSLDSNQIIGLPPSLSKCTSLEFLSLRKNMIGTSRFLAVFPNLTNLDLDNNQITEISGSVCKLVALEYFSLRGNRLTETRNNVPTETPHLLAELVNLKTLDLKNNQFSDIPNSFTKLVNLTNLSFQANKLTRIPKFLARLSQLRVLSLGENVISVIPTAIAAFSQLQVLSLEKNNIIIIPTEVGALTQLHSLSLHHNKIKTAPVALAQLTGLCTLLLNHNNELKKIPREFRKLTNLQVLAIDHTKIKKIPKEIKALNIPNLFSDKKK